MKTNKPILNDYNLTTELVEKNKIQTLDTDYILKEYPSYFISIAVLSAITYWLYKDAISVLLDNLGFAFFGVFFIFPISIGFFAFCLVVFLMIVSSILSYFHPLTKSIKLFQKDLDNYNIQLKEFEEQQFRLKKDFWYSLTGHEFEYEVANLFEKYGFKVQVTKGSNDKGVDINMWNNSKYIVVQCKAHKKRLSPAVSRELYGTMIAHNAKEAYLITLEGISPKSQEFILDKPIKVFDVNNLIKMQEEKITSKYKL